MKKILILSALVTALTSAGAMAADANINFNGTVSASTCTLNAADAAKTLSMPNVSPATLLAAGTGSYTTYNASSSFGFTACPAGLTKVTSTYTYQGALVGATSNTAVPSSGTASNVALVVMQSATGNNAAVLNVNGTSAAINQATIAANAATIPVTVGINALNSSGTATLPTVGTYTGTYLVAFTYS
ncbi:fimbrial protein [Enterobacter asburiae]|uniref:fimbrial protein n=1 Tax=Enterobacter asburiae TaxID=61645 RepID=UPI001FFECF00|nr:pilus assembly protein [Enterobacter asburiae]MCK2177815.1 pilus assembly protein [Enterobacter asburiae]